MGNIRQHLKAEKWGFKRHHNCKMTIPEEVRSVRRYKRGDRVAKIANDNDISQSALQTIIIYKYSTKPSHSPRWTKQERETLLKEGSKKTPKEIAKILDNRSANAIYQKIKNLGILPKKDTFRKYHVNHSFFDDINTPKSAYWLGVLWADGCNKNGRTIQLMIQKGDKQWLQKFKEDLEASHPIYNRDNAVGININSTKLAKSLEGWGIVPRKSQKHIKPKVPNDMQNHFVRGLFDGDGSIGKDSRAEIANTKETCTWLYSLLQDTLDVGGSLRQHPQSDTTYRWRLGGRKQAGKFAKWLYKDATRKLCRKYNKFRQLGLVDGGG